MADQRTESERAKAGGGPLAGFRVTTGTVYRGTIYIDDGKGGYVGTDGQKLADPKFDEAHTAKHGEQFKRVRNEVRPIGAVVPDDDDENDEDDGDETRNPALTSGPQAGGDTSPPRFNAGTVPLPTTGPTGRRETTKPSTRREADEDKERGKGGSR